MRELLTQTALSFLTGLGVGLLFAFVKLPIPAPPTIPAVFGIFGITLGYLLYRAFFGA